MELYPLLITAYFRRGGELNIYLLLLSKQPATGPYPKPDKSSVHIFAFTRFILRSISLLTFHLPNGLFPLGCKTDNFVCTSDLCHACYKSHPAHSLEFACRKAVQKKV